MVRATCCFCGGGVSMSCERSRARRAQELQSAYCRDSSRPRAFDWRNSPSGPARPSSNLGLWAARCGLPNAVASWRGGLRQPRAKAKKIAARRGGSGGSGRSQPAAGRCLLPVIRFIPSDLSNFAAGRIRFIPSDLINFAAGNPVHSI